MELKFTPELMFTADTKLYGAQMLRGTIQSWNEMELAILRVRLAKAEKNAIPHAKKILKNGDYMTVLWADGTNTVVKRAADEAESDYAAFTAAFAIRAMGSNSAVKKEIREKLEYLKKRKSKKKEEQDD